MFPRKTASVISFCGEKRIISSSPLRNDLVITSNGDRALEVCTAAAALGASPQESLFNLFHQTPLADIRL